MHWKRNGWKQVSAVPVRLQAAPWWRHLKCCYPTGTFVLWLDHHHHHPAHAQFIPTYLCHPYSLHVSRSWAFHSTPRQRKRAYILLSRLNLFYVISELRCCSLMRKKPYFVPTPSDPRVLTCSWGCWSFCAILVWLKPHFLRIILRLFGTLSSLLTRGFGEVVRGVQYIYLLALSSIISQQNVQFYPSCDRRL